MVTEPVDLGHPPPSQKMVYIGPAKCLWVVKAINSKSTLAQCKMLYRVAQLKWCHLHFAG